MARFTQYPAATSPTDYTEATNFLIEAPDGTVKLANLEDLRSTFFCGTLCASATIPTAEVLTLGSTPIEIVANPGAGYMIEVISGVVKLDFNTTAYTGGTTIRLITSGGGQPQATCTVLDATVSTNRKFAIVSPSTVTYTQLLENAALNVDAVSAVAAGDSDIEVFVLYRIIAV
jgi:hypothetical protein